MLNILNVRACFGFVELENDSEEEALLLLNVLCEVIWQVQLCLQIYIYYVDELAVVY